MTVKSSYILRVIFGWLVMATAAYADSRSATSVSPADGAPLTPQDIANVKSLFRDLIEAENRHDTAAVKQLVWDSPSTLFVAKTATPEEGNWAGFWGSAVVLQHFVDLYRGTFHMEPDYPKQKIVGLTVDVAEIYTPFKITVSYGGQTPVPKPFLIVMDWIRTPDGWRMASDIAIPVPPASSH